MTIDEKLDMLPEVMLNEITLKETMKVPSHIHQLEKHDGKYARGGWNCDKIRGAKKCLSGLTGFFQSGGVPGYYCRGCNFDMCENCMKADLFIELANGRGQKGGKKDKKTIEQIMRMLKFKDSLKLRALEIKSLEDGNEYIEEILSNGALYRGYKNDEGQREGVGIFTWWDKAKYEGSFKADLRSGYGRIRYTNGDVYEGNWENDLPNGEGVMSYFNGNKYDGQWSDGVQHGPGDFKRADGVHFNTFWK